MRGDAKQENENRPLVLILALQLVVGRALAEDSWWGRDKALHLSAGLVVGAGCYGTLALINHDDPEIRTLLCATLGQIPGLGKELYDSGQPGNIFSGKDLFWTAIGVLASTLALYLVEHLGRGDGP